MRYIVQVSYREDKWEDFRKVGDDPAGLTWEAAVARAVKIRKDGAQACVVEVNAWLLDDWGSWSERLRSARGIHEE